MRKYLRHFSIWTLFWASTLIWFALSILAKSDGGLARGVEHFSIYLAAVFIGSSLLSVLCALASARLSEETSKASTKTIWYVTLAINPPLFLAVWLFYKVREARPAFDEFLKSMAHE